MLWESSKSTYPVCALHSAYHICSILQLGHMLSITFTYMYEAWSCAYEQKAHAYAEWEQSMGVAMMAN